MSVINKAAMPTAISRLYLAMNGRKGLIFSGIIFLSHDSLGKDHDQNSKAERHQVFVFP